MFIILVSGLGMAPVKVVDGSTEHRVARPFPRVLAGKLIRLPTKLSSCASRCYKAALELIVEGGNAL